MTPAVRLLKRGLRMFQRVFPRCSMISQAIAFNLFLAFLQPKIDPSLEMDMEADSVEEGGPVLPTRSDDEFRPFVRRLPEFKFW